MALTFVPSLLYNIFPPSLSFLLSPFLHRACLRRNKSFSPSWTQKSDNEEIWFFWKWNFCPFLPAPKAMRVCAIFIHECIAQDLCRTTPFSTKFAGCLGKKQRSLSGVTYFNLSGFEINLSLWKLSYQKYGLIETGWNYLGQSINVLNFRFVHSLTSGPSL